MVYNKSEDELALDLLKLFGLPQKYVVWFTIHFGAGEIPTVECKIEAWVDNHPVVDGIGAHQRIRTMQNKYKVVVTANMTPARVQKNDCSKLLDKLNRIHRREM